MWTKMLPRTSLGLVAILAVACGESSPATEDATPSTRELLATTVEMSFDQPGSAVAVTVRPLTGGGVTHRVALRVPDGSLAVRSDARGSLTIEHLLVELDDIEISADSVPPHGLALTDLRVAVRQTDVGDTSWSADGEVAIATVEADLTIEWAMSTNGRVVPLAPQLIRGVALQVEVGPDAGGGVHVTVRGGVQGAFLRPAGVFELSDLTVDLTTWR